MGTKDSTVNRMHRDINTIVPFANWAVLGGFTTAGSTWVCNWRGFFGMLAPGSIGDPTIGQSANQAGRQVDSERVSK